MARDYDLGLIINPDVGDEQTRAIVERMTQFVGTHGGQVVRVNAWGRKHLAYPIQRHRDGLYFWFDLILPPETVSELERTLRVNEDIIRHLIRLRDPRTVGQARQREAEIDAQAAAHAAAQAARAEAQAAARPLEPAAELAKEPAAELDTELATEPAAESGEASAVAPSADEEVGEEATDEAQAVASGAEAED